MEPRQLVNIGSVLRTEFKEVNGRQSATITNDDLGIRTKLELDLTGNHLRIFQDRIKQSKPTFASRFDLIDLESWNLDAKTNQVQFVSGAMRLVVAASGTVRVSNAEIPPAEPKPALQLVEVEGIVGNPELKRVKDGTLALWTGGVGEKLDDITRWTNCIAWRALAEEANKYPKGTRVKVTGLFKEAEWTDRETGQIFPKQILVLHSIQAA